MHAADHDRPRAPRLPPSGHDARSREIHRPGRVGAKAGRVVRGRPGGRNPGDPGVARLPLPHRARSAGRGIAASGSPASIASRLTSWRRGCRTSSGRACPTPSCGKAADTRHAARPADPRLPGSADAAGSEGARARRELRRPVAAVPRPRVADPRPRQVPGVRGLPATVDAPRNGALLRGDRQERSQRARLHQRALLVPERAPGAPLRHPERVGTGVPPGRPVGDAARRRADAGQHPRRFLVRHADLAGACAASGCSTTCSMRRRPSRPPTSRTSTKPTIGTSASMREQLEEHRKNAICASCHRRMDPLGFGLENFDAVGAWRDDGGQVPDRRVGPAARRPPFHRPRRAAEDSLGRPRRVCPRDHVEAPDLRARTRPRALRLPDRQAHRQPAAEVRLQVLGPRARNRQQPAVPVAAVRVGVQARPALPRTADRTGPTALVRAPRDESNKESPAP